MSAFARTLSLYRASVTSFSPWKQRPGGLNRHGRPQMVHQGHFRGAYKHRNPDDPSRLLKLNHVLVKQCNSCNRVRFVPLHEKDHYHTCCEGVPMRLKGNMQTALAKERTLQQSLRQWDVERSRPWDNAHRPRPKGRSKLKK